MGSIGILAYGSLINGPGEEIESVIARRIEEDAITPFRVEFARKSSSRDYAPTLIPVSSGGARVRAVILLLQGTISEKHAKDMLWRRETSNIGTSKPYDPPPDPERNSVLIERVKDFHSVDTVLYTRIGSNIDKLTPERLAELADSHEVSELDILLNQDLAESQTLRYLEKTIEVWKDVDDDIPISIEGATHSNVASFRRALEETYVRLHIARTIYPGFGKAKSNLEDEVELTPGSISDLGAKETELAVQITTLKGEIIDLEADLAGS